MSLEVTNAQRIGKGIHSKNPIRPKLPKKKSSKKVRGGKEVVEGEVIEPTNTPVTAHDEEIIDAEVVHPKLGTPPRQISAPQKSIEAPRAPHTVITPIPSAKSPKWKQPTLPGMRSTRQFKGTDGNKA
jgi:hypothetical protein